MSRGPLLPAIVLARRVGSWALGGPDPSGWAPGVGNLPVPVPGTVYTVPVSVPGIYCLRLGLPPYNYIIILVTLQKFYNPGMRRSEAVCATIHVRE